MCVYFPFRYMNVLNEYNNCRVILIMMRILFDELDKQMPFKKNKIDRTAKRVSSTIHFPPFTHQKVSVSLNGLSFPFSFFSEFFKHWRQPTTWKLLGWHTYSIPSTTAHAVLWWCVRSNHITFSRSLYINSFHLHWHFVYSSYYRFACVHHSLFANKQKPKDFSLNLSKTEKYTLDWPDNKRQKTNDNSREFIIK